jgi:methylmalonyl-CoA mutase N-terminal domain/subunit
MSQREIDVEAEPQVHPTRRRAAENVESFINPSGIATQPFYGPRDLEASGWQYAERLADPGHYPYTRGIHPSGYRTRHWTMRQYAGFGTAEETNARYKFLLERGQTGLSVALDLPTQLGFDSDDPMVEEDVGRVGVAIDTLADMEQIFDGIRLDTISTSFTINSTAAVLLAMYAVVAEKQGVPVREIRGTIQNDILKEYVARGTWIFPTEPSLRLIVDTIEWCGLEAPRFNATSVAGAHFRDAGATAAQEMAFTLADGVTYVERCLARGLDIDGFAPQVSFFFYTHMDFFEEIAKYRAGRRIWARLMRERFGAKDPRSWMFRFGLVCGGSTLHAQQPLNNVVRVAYEALASVLGGVQSIFTAAWDEPFAIPTEDSAELALRTQQILACETGVTATVDPLGGSYFVESLTDLMERRILDIMADIDAKGGMVQCIEQGYIQGLIAREAFEKQQRLDAERDVIVGVNRFATGDNHAAEIELFELGEGVRAKQIERLRAVKAARDRERVERALADLTAAAEGSTNLMTPLLKAVGAYCTMGEMIGALRSVFGTFREPVVF